MSKAVFSKYLPVELQTMIVIIKYFYATSCANNSENLGWNLSFVKFKSKNFFFKPVRSVSVSIKFVRQLIFFTFSIIYTSKNQQLLIFFQFVEMFDLIQNSITKNKQKLFVTLEFEAIY